MNVPRFYLSNRRLLVRFSVLLVNLADLLVSFSHLLVNLADLLVNFTLLLVNRHLLVGLF
ncbi:hypothetical protein E2R55_23725 [Vibrio vulnificus]|nr:hypothetical protein E2R55_23725 [Vibrio vulnificus]